MILFSTDILLLLQKKMSANLFDHLIIQTDELEVRHLLLNFIDKNRVLYNIVILKIFWGYI